MRLIRVPCNAVLPMFLCPAATKTASSCTKLVWGRAVSLSVPLPLTVAEEGTAGVFLCCSGSAGSHQHTLAIPLGLQEAAAEPSASQAGLLPPELLRLVLQQLLGDTALEAYPLVKIWEPFALVCKVRSCMGGGEGGGAPDCSLACVSQLSIQ